MSCDAGQMKGEEMVNIDLKKTRILMRVLDRNDRSPEQQLAVLDKRLGVGAGAQKERTKLVLAIIDRTGGSKEAIQRLKRKLFDLNMEAKARKASQKLDCPGRTLLEYSQEQYAANFAA